MTELAYWCKSSMAVKCFPSRDGACRHRENTMLDCKHQRSLVTSVSSPKTPLRHSDIDFHDIFGSPSWWFSNQNTRYSFGEGTESSALRWGEDGVSVCNPWTGLIEKLVLGEDGGNRWRYHYEDSFDDIFRGDNSVNTSPRGHDLYPAVVVPLKMIKLVKPQNSPNIHDDAPSLPILAPLAFICCSWQWRDYDAEKDEDDDVAIHGCTTLIDCGYIIWRSTRDHEQKSIRTIRMLSQLHISILKPSPSWKKSRSILFFFPFLLFQVIKFFPFPKTSSSSSVSSPKIIFISPPAYASSSFLFPSRWLHQHGKDTSPIRRELAMSSATAKHDQNFSFEHGSHSVHMNAAFFFLYMPNRFGKFPTET